MSNRVLKTGLLSLTAASLLTSSVMGAITVNYEDTTDNFTKKAGRLDVMKFTLNANTVSKLNKLTLTVADKNDSGDELNHQIFSELRIYQRGLDSTDIKAVVAAKDFNISGEDVVFDFTDKSVFFKTADDDHPNIFYVSGTYNDFPDKTIVPHDSSVTFTVKEIKATENYYKDTTALTLNESATSSVVTIATTTTTDNERIVTIDRKAPDINLDNSNFTLSANKYNNENNTNYKFSENVIRYDFNEGLSTTDLNLESIAEAFKVTDSKGNNISILDYSAIEDELNITLSGAELNKSTGSINIVYSGSIIKDDFGNETFNENDSNLSKEIFKDTSFPKIASLILDFDDKSKGRLTFSEAVQMSDWSKINLISSGDEFNVTKILNHEDVADSDHGYSLRTVIDFELNGTAPRDFNLTFSSSKEGNVTDYADNTMPTDNETYSIPKNGFGIEKGWNLIALASDTRTTSKRILENSKGAVAMIWDYDATTSKWNSFPENLQAGKGYWVKGNGFGDFAEVEIGKSDTKTIETDDASIIKTEGAKVPNKWTLVGISGNLSWEEAYSQVADGCYGVSIYAYQNDSNDSYDGWNMNPTVIPEHSGVWVKQDCDNNYNIEQ